MAMPQVAKQSLARCCRRGCCWYSVCKCTHQSLYMKADFDPLRPVCTGARAAASAGNLEVLGVPNSSCLSMMIALRHLLLYSQEPDHSLVRFDEMDLLHPGDDAFTAAMKSFMRHACRSGQLPAAKCRSTAAGGTTAVAR